MKFSYYDLGNLDKGKIVEVQLSVAANVRLMDSSNYSRYKSGKKHQYYGGYVTKSPYKIIVPSSKHWYVTIDLGGYSGRLRHSVRILDGVLPIAKQQLPLAEEPNLYVGNIASGKEYDVFISHTSVYSMFGITRDILKSKGRQAQQFTKIAIIVLNQIIRPFTTKWHEKKLKGAFNLPEECKVFRNELSVLQNQLKCYSRLLADLSKVEDLTDML